MFLGTLWGSQKSVASKNILVTTPPKSQMKKRTKTAIGAGYGAKYEPVHLRHNTTKEKHHNTLNK